MARLRREHDRLLGNGYCTRPSKHNATTPQPRAKTTAPNLYKGEGNTRRCSFCGKTQTEVEHMIAGPGFFICNECVALCDLLIANKPAPHFPPLDEKNDDELLADMACISASRDQVEEAVNRVHRLRVRREPRRVKPEAGDVTGQPPQPGQCFRAGD